MKNLLSLLIVFVFLSSQEKAFLVVLGNAQDAGAPQAMCQKDCCKERWEKGIRHYATSLALIDPNTKTYYLFEATPDFKYQFAHVQKNYPAFRLAGIFLTHAHVGHYAGLIHLGREIVGAKSVPVFVMPNMARYLTNNGPWSQLVDLKNILLIKMTDEEKQNLSRDLSVTPFRVPHRDEFSETVGYNITFENKTVFFIPDINKWSAWEKSLTKLVKNSHVSILDASFYSDKELPGRNMSEIPHPFVPETMALLNGLSNKEKSKVLFIHFNHTNPLLNINSDEYKLTLSKFYKIAKFSDIITF